MSLRHRLDPTRPLECLEATAAAMSEDDMTTRDAAQVLNCSMLSACPLREACKTRLLDVLRNFEVKGDG